MNQIFNLLFRVHWLGFMRSIIAFNSGALSMSRRACGRQHFKAVIVGVTPMHAHLITCNMPHICFSILFVWKCSWFFQYMLLSPISHNLLVLSDSLSPIESVLPTSCKKNPQLLVWCHLTSQVIWVRGQKRSS